MRWLRIFNALMVAFMLAPLVMIVWMSFTPSAMFKLPLTSFSFKWYAEAFNYPGFLNAFLLSMKLALIAATLATLRVSSLTTHSITAQSLLARISSASYASDQAPGASCGLW